MPMGIMTLLKWGCVETSEPHLPDQAVFGGVQEGTDFVEKRRCWCADNIIQARSQRARVFSCFPRAQLNLCGCRSNQFGPIVKGEPYCRMRTKCTTVTLVMSLKANIRAWSVNYLTQPSSQAHQKFMSIWPDSLMYRGKAASPAGTEIRLVGDVRLVRTCKAGKYPLERQPRALLTSVVLDPNCGTYSDSRQVICCCQRRLH